MNEEKGKGKEGSNQAMNSICINTVDGFVKAVCKNIFIASVGSNALFGNGLL